MPIIKREIETFNTKMIEELERKYPKHNKKTNQEYKRKLEYITYDTNFHDSHSYLTMISKGHDTVLLYQFIRECIGADNDGYKYRVDGNRKDILLNKAAFYLQISKERAYELYDFLLEQLIMVEIEYNNATWLLDERSVWNFEILNAARVNSRQSTADSREKEKSTNNTQQKPKEQAPEPEASYDVNSLESEAVPAGFWDDTASLPDELPFD